MTRQEIFDNIETVLAQLTDDDLIEAWNEYNRSINNDEYIIHVMSDLDYELRNYKPSDILEVCHELDYNDDYFCWNYNFLISFNDIYDVYDEYELINAMIDNMDTYGVDEVGYMFDGLESED